MGPAEETGVFTAIEELSDLREIHSAEKYSYLMLFPDGEPHAVIHPSFVILDFRSLSDEDRAALEHVREWDERLGVKLLELHVFEDAQTRFCGVASSSGKVIQEFPPPPGYNPHEYAEAYILYLRSMGIAVSESMERSLYEMLDPARMTLRIRVLDLESAEILADNIASRSLAPPGEGIGLLGDSGRQKFELTEITKDASNVVTLSFTGVGSVARLAPYWQDGPDYSPPAMKLADPLPVSEGLTSWRDENGTDRNSSAEAGSRYYTCFNLDRPYLQHIKTDGVTVMWLWPYSSKNPRVQYSKDNWQTTNEKVDEDGSPQEVGDFYVYTVKLESLSEDTLYEYQAFWGTRTSAVHSFRTLKSSPDSFRFVVYGDNRGGDDTNIRREHVEVVGLGILGAGRADPPPEPQFVVHVGDYVHDDEQQNADQWLPQFFLPASPLIANSPLFPCIGNHEYNYDDDASNYLAFFEYPKAYNPVTPAWEEKTWYSFDYGNCHFIFLDTNDDIGTGSLQRQWLTGYDTWPGDLNDAYQRKQSHTIDWIIVILHKPLYTDRSLDTSTSHDGTTAGGHPYSDSSGLRGNLENELKGKADIVLCGHNHFYERSLFWKQETPALAQGTIHVVTGGGGAPGDGARHHRPFWHDTNPAVSNNPYRQYAEAAFESSVVEVGANELVVKASRNDGTVLDFDVMDINRNHLWTKIQSNNLVLRQPHQIIPKGSQWRYNQSGANLAGTLWKSVFYSCPSEDGWEPEAAPARFGFGYDGEVTRLTQTGHTTYYFRHKFGGLTQDDIDQMRFLFLSVLHDDGCVVYLNSQEVFRSNLRKPSTYSTLATNDIGRPYENAYLRCLVDSSVLEPGENANVIAVEIHQAASQADLGFDLSLQYFTNNWASE